jgi:hypothetical protein
MLLALYCCRIMKVTLEFGFCEETIPAITYVSYGMLCNLPMICVALYVLLCSHISYILLHKALFHYGGDTELATRLIRIAESLISIHPNEHTLLAKSNFFICAVTALVEPFHASHQRCLKGYNSAQVVGDVDSAMNLSLNSCVACIYSIPDLVSAQRDVTYFFHQHVSITCICFVSPNTTLLSHTISANLTRVSTGDSLSSIVSCVSLTYAQL